MNFSPIFWNLLKRRGREIFDDSALEGRKMNIIDLIEKKKNGLVLTRDEIVYFVQGAAKGTIKDYQLSALLMAIRLKGMNEEETYYLTDSMADSGDRADLSGIFGPTGDKHSTGGVGDSTTFIVAPAAAVLGIRMAKMSGRALGHTGGTIDKLEAIPGFKSMLEPKEFIEQVNRVGLAVTGQSGNLCPADKALYALRDVTGTVDSVPLIASSVMSKKLAGGAENIVLDIKCGNGAFMATPEAATELAALMCSIGRAAGRRMVAAVTDMNEPLDPCIGNRLELLGAVRVLKGDKGRLYDIAVLLTALLAEQALKIPFQDDEKRVKTLIDTGKAYENFREMSSAQGGDLHYIDNQENNPYSPKSLISKSKGFIGSIDTAGIGRALIDLGAGRRVKEDSIDYDAGVIMSVKIGDYVNVGDELMKVYGPLTENNADALLSAFGVIPIKPPDKQLVINVIR
jgi:pyrimidine-nucleoside phosphorylase